jgi:outer membrane immunogenic protein
LKKLVLVLAALTIGTGGASAADLPARSYAKAPVVVSPVATWTGCYIGVNAGYSWGDGSATLALQPSLAAWIPNPAFAAFAVFDGRYASSPSGALGGGQVGCNYQSGMFVFGVETDIDYLGASRTTNRTGVVGVVPELGTLTQKLDWLGSVRGRVGIAPGSSWLLYATGGLAYGNTNFSHQFIRTDFAPNAGFAGTLNDDLRTGWIVGVGAEYKVTSNWTVKAEYLYYDLGSIRIVGAPFNQPANGFGADGLYTTRGSIARVGLNYLFGGPVVARY